MKPGGVVKEADAFLLKKTKLPIPIVMGSPIFTLNKANLRYTQMDERDMVRGAYFNAAF